MTDRISAWEIGEAFDGSCPVCNHDAFRVYLDRLHRPESPRYVVTCIKCGESGDFLDVNDYIYNSLNRIRSLSSELEKAKAELSALKMPDKTNPVASLVNALAFDWETKEKLNQYLVELQAERDAWKMRFLERTSHE